MTTATYTVTTSKFEVVQARGTQQAYGVVTLPSSDGKREYRVDVSTGRCSCPAWKFQRERKMCKHLKAMGFVDLVKADSKDFAEVL